jgi:hypothetical protein
MPDIAMACGIDSKNDETAEGKKGTKTVGDAVGDLLTPTVAGDGAHGWFSRTVALIKAYSLSGMWILAKLPQIY